MTDLGVIYYATGKEYVEEALASAESLKQHNDVPVTVYSNKKIDSPHIDNVVPITSGEYPFYDRINYFKQTPYDKTLHLDTDTVVLKNISSIFEMLENFDVVASINETRDTASKGHKFDTVDIDAPEAFPEYQCGVIGFCDKPDVMTLFDDWQDRYADYRDRFVLDQPFFREALYHSDIRLGTLPSEYNALLYLGGYFEQEIRIVHFAGSKHETFFPFMDNRSTDEAVAALDTNEPSKRVLFYDEWNRLRVKSTYGNTRLPFRIVRSINKDGFTGTMLKAIRELV